MSLVTVCNNADCFTFIPNEPTAVSIKEQLVVCVRFVHKNPDNDNRMKHSVCDEFLSFVHADTGTKFLESVDSAGIIQQQMHGLGYDGASVMSENVGGVKSRIRAIILRLCIVHS